MNGPCGRAITLIILAIVTAALAACGGGGNGPAGLVPPEGVTPAATVPTPGAPLPPEDAYIDPAEIIARRGSELIGRELSGSEAYAASANTSAEDQALRFSPAGRPAGSWAVYAFADLTDGDYPLELSTCFDPDADPPAPYYFGISDYTHNTWFWIEVGVPTGTDTLPVPQDIDTVSPGGNLYAAVMIPGEAEAVLETVALRLDSYYLPAPANLAAGESTVDDAIQLSWDDPAVTYPGLDFPGVAVERTLDPAGDWEQLAEVGPEVTGYSDETVTGLGVDPLELVYYRLRTVSGEHRGSPGLATAGWLPLPPVEYLMASDILPDRIEISWSPVAAAGSYEIEYRVSMSSGFSWEPLVEVDALLGTTFVHTDDNPPEQSSYRTSYFYRVRATQGEHTSREWSPVDEGYRPYGDGFNASDAASPNEIQLTWSGQSRRDSYLINYRNSSGGYPAEWTYLAEVSMAELPLNESPEFLHTGDEPAGQGAAYGQVYEYRLLGMLAGEVRDEILGEDTGLRAIGDVTGLAATQNDAARISLAWGETPDAETYHIEYRNLDGGAPVDWAPLIETSSPGTSFEHTAASPVGAEAQSGVMYEYRAKAGWSGEVSKAWSDPVTGAMRLGNVTGFSATDGYYPERTALTWDQLPQTDTYEIEYRNTDGGSPMDWSALVEINDISATAFDHTTTEPAGKGCVPLDRYEYRIRGHWGADYSPGWAGDTGYCGSGPGDWFMDGRDRRNQRRSPHIGPETPELLWTYETNEYSLGPASQALDGTVYLCGSWGDLYALNADGSERWVYDDLQCGHSITPCIGDGGTVYCSGLDLDGALGYGFYLHAVNPNGSTKWTEYAGYLQGGYSVTASPVTTPSGLIIWSHSLRTYPIVGRLLATSAEGATQWAYTGSCGVLTTPAIDDGGLIYATCSDFPHDAGWWIPDYNLHAINSDGSQAWAAPELGQGFSPSIGDDGRIYVVLGDYPECDLYCYEPDGTVAWSLNFPVSGWSGVAIGSDGCIYTGFFNSSTVANYTMYAVNPAGSLRWTYEVPYTPYSESVVGAPVIDGNGTIYIGGPDGLHAINPDGTRKWLYPTDRPVKFSPTIGNDGTLYLAAGGTVYTVGPGAG